jgi:uncharacterized protein
VLVDAGPLIALIDRDEADHTRCVEVLNSIELPMRTTWPALTEAMHLLGRAGGHRAQAALWSLCDDERVAVVELSASCRHRSAELMAKYQDLPMDLADATLVAVAEETGDDFVFTLDSDFSVYRLHGRKRFRIVPR